MVPGTLGAMAVACFELTLSGALGGGFLLCPGLAPLFRDASMAAAFGGWENAACPDAGMRPSNCRVEACRCSTGCATAD